MKVEKPEITPIPLHTQQFSGFAERLLSQKPEEIEARFADLDTEITQLPVANGIDLHHLPNPENGIFELLYVFDFGTQSDRWICIATKYLSFLGTSILSNAEVQVAFYRLGLEWQIQASSHRTYLGINGLDAHLPEGLVLLEQLLRDCQPDAEKLANYVEDIEQKRRNRRADKQQVLRSGLNQYGRFGEKSPLANAPSLSELKSTTAEELTARIQALAQTRHQVFYYGPRSAAEVVGLLRERAQLPKVPRINPAPEPSQVIIPQHDRVLFVHFPMVQVEILLLRHVREGFDAESWAKAEWFNQYYGLGLSSVVFQELRESRALAYSTYAYAESPARADEHHFLQAFIGTQPDKLLTALTALRDLLSNWTWDAEAAKRVKAGILQQMQTERDLRQSRYWLWRQAKDRGMSGNQRKWLYERMQTLSTDDLASFFSQLSLKPTTYLVIGDKQRINFDDLKPFGEITELNLDTIFGGDLD